MISSTSSQDVNSTTPTGVFCVEPTFTRGLSQRRKASVTVPAAIPSRSAAVVAALRQAVCPGFVADLESAPVAEAQAALPRIV